MVDSIRLRFQPQRYFNSKNRKLIYYFIRNKSLPSFRWCNERILFALIRRFNRNIEWNVISRGLQFSTQFHGKLFLNRPIQLALVNGPRMNGGPREPDLCTHAHTPSPFPPPSSSPVPFTPPLDIAKRNVGRDDIKATAGEKLMRWWHLVFRID